MQLNAEAATAPTKPRAAVSETGCVEPAVALLAPPVPETAATSASLPAKFVEGFIDGINGRKVTGWAWCRSVPTAAVEVELHVGHRVAAVLRAEAFRSDLAKAGVGDGRHGFSVMLEDAVPPEEKTLVAAFVRCDAEGGKVALVNRTIKPTVEAPARATAETDMQPVLLALAAMSKGFDDKLQTLGKTLAAASATRPDGAAATKQAAETAAELRSVREELTRIATTAELLQLRIDAVHAAVVGDGTVERRGGSGEKGLTIVVAALAVVSCSALALGLAGFFF